MLSRAIADICSFVQFFLVKSSVARSLPGQKGTPAALSAHRRGSSSYRSILSAKQVLAVLLRHMARSCPASLIAFFQKHAAGSRVRIHPVYHPARQQSPYPGPHLLFDSLQAGGGQIVAGRFSIEPEVQQLAQHCAMAWLHHSCRFLPETVVGHWHKRVRVFSESGFILPNIRPAQAEKRIPIQITTMITRRLF